MSLRESFKVKVHAEQLALGLRVTPIRETANGRWEIPYAIKDVNPDDIRAAFDSMIDKNGLNQEGLKFDSRGVTTDDHGILEFKFALSADNKNDLEVFRIQLEDAVAPDYFLT